jgi:hypothetical protein
LSVVGQQRRRSLPANELIETKLVLMADFFFFFSLSFSYLPNSNKDCVWLIFMNHFCNLLFGARERWRKRGGGEKE